MRVSESLQLLEAMRPRQWSKNVFVLAGIVFAFLVAPSVIEDLESYEDE